MANKITYICDGHGCGKENTITRPEGINGIESRWPPDFGCVTCPECGGTSQIHFRDLEREQNPLSGAMEIAMESESFLYNYVTEEYEPVVVSELKDWSDYVPQTGGRGLYKILVEHKGYTPIGAAKEVLEAATGKGKHAR